MIVSTNSLTKDGEYQWELKMLQGGRLEGRPWDAVKEPRLTIIDRRVNKAHLPPSISMEVRCLREDIHISDIQLKDQRSWLNVVSSENKRIAAEAYIRQKLSEVSLPVTSISDAFASLIVASVIAES